MSASLVGSEMCIRDRGMSSPQRWGRLAYHFDRHFQVTAYLALASTVPVSYTHLTLPTICSV
eukprot:9516699-Alexandrium_andersonii.AAC.1